VKHLIVRASSVIALIMMAFADCTHGKVALQSCPSDGAGCPSAGGARVRYLKLLIGPAMPGLELLPHLARQLGPQQPVDAKDHG
jgi:hypothetical protein